MIKKAIVLSSGGVDSSTTMAIAKHEGYEIYALTFLYGQRHFCEVEASKKVADFLGATKHFILNIELNRIGGSALTDIKINVPKGRNIEDMAEGIPISYVPARNTIFLAYSLAWAEVLSISDIFIGVNAIDYSGYPDCRLEYIEAFEKMANLATKTGIEGISKIKIRTPLIQMTKEQIIRKGIELGFDYSLTHSCYDPLDDGIACGQCDSCIIRKNGFKKAGIIDPIKYVS
ncbi:MAG: 7-cyano-7-deazaguanine synthase QueC [Desulfobacterales bacterium]|nr:7-cyano-7-deazaguanine synthase QueC [Desulfobacterales bacterium]